MKEKVQKSDRRVRRTKRVLAVALVDLLTEKPLNRITVKEVTEIADVNRATFYRHYQDIYDMFYQIEDELLAEFKKAVTVGTLGNYDDLGAFYHRIFKFVEDNADLGQLLCGPNSNQVLDKFKEVVFEFLNQNCIAIDSGVNHFTNSFITAGIIEVIKQWLNEKIPVPSKEMAEYIITSVRSGFPLDLWNPEQGI